MGGEFQVLIFYNVKEETISINLAYRTIITTAAKSAFAGVFFFIINFSLNAATCITTANDSWDCGTPAPSDDLIVNHHVTINGDFDLTGSITVNNGGHLTISGGMVASISDIYVYNGGTLIIQGAVDLSANCNFIVEGYAELNQTFIVQNSSLVRVSGSILAQGFVTIDGGGTLDIEIDGVFDTNSDFLANSNLTNIDGALNILGSFTNHKSITGNGQITYTNECLGTGTINGYTSAEYCGTGIIDLNALDCSATDNTNPVFDTFPPDQNLYLTAEVCEITANWVLPTVSDNCGIQELVSTANSGESFPVGESTVIYTVLDLAGNSTQQSLTITVLDTISPVFVSFPSDQTVSTDASSCTAVVNWTGPEAADNCTVSSITSSHNSGDEFSIGDTEVIYTVTDASGNSTQQSFFITVEDNINPTFSTFPSNQTVSTDASSCTAVVKWIAPEAADNCTVSSITSSHNSGDAFSIGDTEVIYTATDASGNSTQQSFIITVEDNINPTFSTFPSNQTVSNDASSCTAFVNWTAPEATDNCTVSSITSSHNSEDEFSIGDTEVIYTATDASGNSTQQSFIITVEDSSPPAFISFPSDISVNAEENSCSATVAWPVPEVLDNCTEVTITSNYQSGDQFPSGVSEVTYTISDAAGNSTSQSFTITVQDQTPPVFITCPENYTLESTDTLKNASVVTWDQPTVEDNCSNVTLQSNFQPGDDFTMGISEVVYTAYDETGNTATCSFNVEVYINLPPTANNISKYIQAGESIDICLSASDPNSDIISIKEIRHDKDLASVSNIDVNELCFLYTADVDFYGKDTVFVVLQDNGSPVKTTTVSVIIEVERNIDIDINDVITMNGDMINDSWQIKNIDQYPNNSVSVFDRSGGLVFKCSGYNNNTVVWSGESNSGFLNAGGLVTTGTYFYAIDLGNGSKMLTGAIEVVR